MSVTIPLSTAWLMVLIYVSAPIVCAVTTIMTHRWYTKAQRSNLRERERAVAQSQQRVLRRENKVYDREQKVYRREDAMKRKAQDIDSQIKSTVYQVTQDDTTIVR